MCHSSTWANGMRIRRCSSTFHRNQFTRRSDAGYHASNTPPQGEIHIRGLPFLWATISAPKLHHPKILTVLCSFPIFTSLRNVVACQRRYPCINRPVRNHWVHCYDALSPSETKGEVLRFLLLLSSIRTNAFEDPWTDYLHCQNHRQSSSALKNGCKIPVPFICYLSVSPVITLKKLYFFLFLCYF